MSTLHIPPAVQPVIGTPVFLAGPIKGAPDWQSQAIARILATAPELDIISPRRPEAAFADFDEAKYMEQVDWEHDHLAIAADRGVTMFWLAKEAHHEPDQSYAQTTRFELGEAMTLQRLTGAIVVVGIEEGFTNALYLRRTIAKKAPGIPLFDSFDLTIEAAVELARLRGAR